MSRSNGAKNTFTERQIAQADIEDGVVDVQAEPIERLSGKFAPGQSGNSKGRPKGSGKKLNECLSTILYEEGGAELMARRLYAAAINKRNPSIALTASKLIADRVEPVSNTLNVVQTMDPGTVQRIAEAYDMWLEYKGLKGGVQPELKLAQGDAE